MLIRRPLFLGLRLHTATSRSAHPYEPTALPRFPRLRLSMALVNYDISSGQ
jgi:hypothetical protein